MSKWITSICMYVCMYAWWCLPRKSNIPGLDDLSTCFWKGRYFKRYFRYMQINRKMTACYERPCGWWCCRASRHIPHCPLLGLLQHTTKKSKQSSTQSSTIERKVWRKESSRQMLNSVLGLEQMPFVLIFVCCSPSLCSCLPHCFFLKNLFSSACLACLNA